MVNSNLGRTKAASSIEALRKRVLRLLELDGPGKKKTEITSKIIPTLTELGDAALIGGAIRDIARGGRQAFKSDLDFVIYGSSRTFFQKKMEQYSPQPNKFGGYRIFFSAWKVDVWHIDDTWAKTQHLRPVSSLPDLLSCTFFDWDSILFDLNTKRLVCNQDYLSRIQSGIMNMELEENPNPQGALVRALRRAALWNISFGIGLSLFASKYLKEFEWSELVERDRRAFATSVLTYLNKEELLCKLEDGLRTDTKSIQLFPKWKQQSEMHFDDLEDSGVITRTEAFGASA